MTEQKVLVYFDLDSKQYDMETLIKNINSLNLLKIIRKQKLTLDFIKNYILNDEYQCTPEEQYIDKNKTLYYSINTI